MFDRIIWSHPITAGITARSQAIRFHPMLIGTVLDTSAIVPWPTITLRIGQSFTGPFFLEHSLTIP